MGFESQKFEQKTFYFSHRIESQKMIRMMKKEAYEVCTKIKAKYMSEIQNADLIQKH